MRRRRGRPPLRQVYRRELSQSYVEPCGKVSSFVATHVGSSENGSADRGRQRSRRTHKEHGSAWRNRGNRVADPQRLRGSIEPASHLITASSDRPAAPSGSKARSTRRQGHSPTLRFDLVSFDSLGHIRAGVGQLILAASSMRLCCRQDASPTRRPVRAGSRFAECRRPDRTASSET